MEQRRGTCHLCHRADARARPKGPIGNPGHDFDQVVGARPDVHVGIRRVEFHRVINYIKTGSADHFTKMILDSVKPVHGSLTLKRNSSSVSSHACRCGRHVDLNTNEAL